MIRTLITIVLPLALPTILYLSWAAWAKKRIEANRAEAAANGATAEELAQYEISTPWLRLVLAGVGLLVVGLIISTLLGGRTDADAVYQPPREVDGEIQPGRFVPKDQVPGGANTMKTPATEESQGN